jgi:type I restriction enzyme S subunit
MTCLGEVASLERKSLLPEEIETGTSYLGLEHIESGGRILGYQRVGAGELQSNKFMFDPGTLLYGKLRPYLAKICIPDRDGCCSTDILPIRPSQKLDISYLKHVLLWKPYVDKANSLCSGANLPRISPSSLLGIEIPLPPLEEQRRIAAILDKAESIESLAVKRSFVWPKFARSLFCEMFGGVNSNPFKYPVTGLGDLLSNAEIFRDGDWVESKDQDPAGDVRLIQLADVGDGFYVDKSSRFLTYDTSIRLRCTHLRRGDILVARMPDPLCRACIFPGDSKISVTVVDVCIIRVDPAAADPIWLTWMINSPEFRSNAISSATGTTRSRVSRGNLSKLPVLLPPLVAQKHFALTLSKAMSLFGHENLSCSSNSFHRIRRVAAALRDEVFCSQK